jgi:hypothetical protein
MGLYVNPFDPDETAHVSTQLAALVVGEHRFDGMSHELRTMRMAALIRTYNAVIDIGDLEHTADWDWRITITTNDGLEYPPASCETTMCDVLELPYTVEPGDYTSNFSRWEILKAEMYNWQPVIEGKDISWAEIAIDDIQSITIEEL